MLSVDHSKTIHLLTVPDLPLCLCVLKHKASLARGASSSCQFSFYDQLSRGSVSVRTAEFIKELERKLPVENKPVKLFSLNYDVDKCNSDNLLQLEGTIMYFSIKNNSLQISRIYGASIVCGFKL